MFAEPMFSSSGGYLGHIGLCADITDRVRSSKNANFELSLNQFHIRRDAGRNSCRQSSGNRSLLHNKRFLGIWGLDDSTAQDPLPDDFHRIRGSNIDVIGP